MGALVAHYACHPIRPIAEFFGRILHPRNHGLGNREFVEISVKHAGDGGFADVAVAGDISYSNPASVALLLFPCFFHVYTAFQTEAGGVATAKNAGNAKENPTNQTFPSLPFLAFPAFFRG